jgi:hypothetical protein
MLSGFVRAVLPEVTCAASKRRLNTEMTSNRHGSELLSTQMLTNWHQNAGVPVLPDGTHASHFNVGLPWQPQQLYVPMETREDETKQSEGRNVRP